MAEETSEYTTTRQDTLERHEIIVPEFVQRTFSLQQLGLRALLGLLRAGTSPSQLHEATLRGSVSTGPLSASTPSAFSPPPPSVSSSSSAPALLGSVGGLAELLPLLLGLL